MIKSAIKYRTLCQYLPASTKKLSRDLNRSRFAVDGTLRRMAAKGIVVMVKRGDHYLAKDWEEKLDAHEDDSDTGLCDCCGNYGYRVLFQKKRVCSACLNPEYKPSFNKSIQITSFPVDF